MSTFYFSGIEKRASVQVLGLEKAAGMLNRLQYSPTLMEVCDEYNLPLVMDCGAFTKPLTTQDIEEYAQLITDLGDRFVWYANADKIGDQLQSNKNYEMLLSLLPPLLHTRILWIYQYGSDLKHLYQGMEKHQRIGIGGLVPLLADRQRAYHLICNLAQVIARYDVQPHYFGLSSINLLKALHNYHKDYSVDSTTWLAGGRYGVLINAKGQQRPATEGGYDFPTSAILAQNVRTMRKWLEGSVVKKPSIETQQSLFDRELTA